MVEGEKAKDGMFSLLFSCFPPRRKGRGGDANAFFPFSPSFSILREYRAVEVQMPFFLFFPSRVRENT